jgi:arylsulfatase A-like enzyme
VKKHGFLGKRLDNKMFRHMLHRVTNEEEARNFIAHTYGMVSMIDDSVGQILAALEKLGFADNTMIVYTSDHGDMMGDHGMILKGWIPYDGVLRVPLIWKVPGVTQRGVVSDSLVSAVDLAPTILNLSNIDKNKFPPDMQGVDITPVLKDPIVKVRESCLIEIDEADNRMAKNMPMALNAMGGSLDYRVKYLITEKYSLAIYNGLRGHGDLYDRANDPLQLNNLWYSNPELRLELVEQLLHEVINAQSLYPKKQGMG